MRLSLHHLIDREESNFYAERHNYLKVDPQLLETYNFCQFASKFILKVQNFTKEEKL